MVRASKRTRLSSLADSCISTVLTSAYLPEAYNDIGQLPIKLQLQILQQMTTEPCDIDAHVFTSILRNWPLKHIRLRLATGIQGNDACIEQSMRLMKMLLETVSRRSTGRIKAIDISTKPEFSNVTIACHNYKNCLLQFLNQQPVTFFSHSDVSLTDTSINHTMILIDLSVFTRPQYKQQLDQTAFLLHPSYEVRFVVQNLYLDQPPEHASLTLKYIDPKYLKYLHFSEYKLPSSAIAQDHDLDIDECLFKVISKFPKLRWLNLPTYVRSPVTENLVCDTLKVMKDLETFVLNDRHRIYADHIPAILSTLLSPNLREIHLKNIRITKSVIHAIASNPSLSQITSLHLENIEGIDDVILELCLLICKGSLMNVCFSGSDISEWGVLGIFAASKNSNVKLLTLPEKFQNMLQTPTGCQSYPKLDLKSPVTGLHSTCAVEYSDHGHQYRILNHKSPSKWFITSSS